MCIFSHTFYCCYKSLLLHWAFAFLWSFIYLFIAFFFILPFLTFLFFIISIFNFLKPISFGPHKKKVRIIAIKADQNSLKEGASSTNIRK